MKSFNVKLVAGLAMIASVAFLAGCGNSNSSGGSGGVGAGVYSNAFGGSVACSQGMSPYMFMAVDQTAGGLNFNLQVYTDSTFQNIIATCGTVDVAPVFQNPGNGIPGTPAGQCWIEAGHYNVGMISPATNQRFVQSFQVPPNGIQRTGAGAIIALNFQFVNSTASYSAVLEANLNGAGTQQMMQNGQMVTTAISATSLPTSPCNDTQGENL